MEYTVFYSWQSDLPNATNRGFIQRALEKAAQVVAADDTISISPRIDRDTDGVPGSPEIANTIFNKIDNSSIFVCDVSIVNKGEKPRPMPNPNVLLELGWAAKSLGWANIILVFNEEYGSIEDLPFDLRPRRITPYRAKPEEEDRSAERDRLAKIFESAFRAMAMHKPISEIPGTVEILAVPVAETVVSAIESVAPNESLVVRRYIPSLVEQLKSIAPDWSKEGEPDDILIESIYASLPITVEFGKVVTTVAAMNSHRAAQELYKLFESIVTLSDDPEGFSSTSNKSHFDFYRFIGHQYFTMLFAALLREDELTIMRELLDTRIRRMRTWNSVDRPSAHYTELSNRTLDLLRRRNTRLGLNRRMLQADILKELHDQTELSGQVSLEELAAGDIYLALRAGCEDVSGRKIWIPVSWDREPGVPLFILNAEKRPYAERLSTSLGTDITGLRKSLALTQELCTRMNPYTFHTRPLTEYDFDAIASK